MTAKPKSQKRRRIAAAIIATALGATAAGALVAGPLSGAGNAGVTWRVANR